ncbi:hypothetical protein OEB99_12510 [Actinotalea sp. M2MS4P-6]|uniref:hypothetical protein n=1 Tax=Actinotalea sp. M2MS4P-6 TaxID=2983762 RepID=UPI0021E4D18E|nr:hypothetical protein [Actinotalea sp. M2MS4P-6]MCV2395131.1 hypothetical protein [Actinotalea sp. M2MS4P-6]
MQLLSGSTADDRASGRQWLLAAAKSGHAMAMFNQGVTNETVEPDAAHTWYERAAAGPSG